MELPVRLASARLSYLLIVISAATVFLLIHLYNKEQSLEDFAIIDDISNSEIIIDRHHDDDETSKKKRLAVLVPLRNAFDELLVFLPAITSFLDQHRINFEIFLINQVDRFRFNRGALLNVGYLHVRDAFDYVILHDVDVYPIKVNISYGYPGDGSVFHVIPFYLHPNKHINYEDYLGSILALPIEVYERVDGISNDFWGWGGEDDDLSIVLKKANITIRRTSQLVGNKSDTFVHIHSLNRQRDQIVCKGQNRDEQYKHREPNSGLNSTQFTIRSVQRIAIDECAATLLNVELRCNKTRTPWCDCV